MFFCNTICFTAKLYDQPYLKTSTTFKKNIKDSISFLHSKFDISNQDLSLVETLLKVIEVLDETSSTIRKNLIRLRNELVLWQQDKNMSMQRKQMIELSIEMINLLHYATFLCSNLDKIQLKFDSFKKNIKHFKETSLNNLNKVDIIYIGYLYKIPTLIIIKRGFLEEVQRRKAEKAASNEPNTQSNDVNNDPDLI